MKSRLIGSSTQIVLALWWNSVHRSAVETSNSIRFQIFCDSRSPYMYRDFSQHVSREGLSVGLENILALSCLTLTSYRFPNWKKHGEVRIIVILIVLKLIITFANIDLGRRAIRPITSTWGCVAICGQSIKRPSRAHSCGHCSNNIESVLGHGECKKIHFRLRGHDNSILVDSKSVDCLTAHCHAWDIS